MKKTILITNGPSREELFDGLRLFAEKRKVNFVFENEHNELELKLPTRIKAIEYSSDSDQIWEVKLLIKTKNLPQFGLPTNFRLMFAGHDDVIFNIIYLTKTRKGVLSY